MLKKPKLSTYALYFTIVFWSISCVLYVFAVSKGMIGVTCIGIACAITHLFYKHNHRFMDNKEQRNLAFSCVISILIYSWIPLGLLYFLYLNDENKQLFISLFHPKVLPITFVSIGSVSVVSFLVIWGTIKAYSYLMKKDIEKDKLVSSFKKHNESIQKEKIMSDKFIKLPVNKALFYFRDCWDFEWEVFRIFDSRNGLRDESYNLEMPEILKGKLSNIIITMKYFPFISGMIGNGGYFYFYESYLGWKTLPCIQGLYELGEYDTVQMLLYTYADYQFHAEECLAQDRTQFLALSNAEQINQIHAYLSENVPNFDEMAQHFRIKEYAYGEFERKFWRTSYQTMQNIVEHIKSNPNDYVTDEDGKPFDLNFTGTYSKPNDTKDYVLPMQNGKPHGHFKIFNNTKEVKEYSGEFEHGMLKNYCYTYHSDYDNSNTKKLFEFEIVESKVIKVETEYCKNSDQPKKQRRSYKYSLGVRVGEQKEWYENGQIDSIEFYENDKQIKWISYYEDGRLWSEGEVTEQGRIGNSWFRNGTKRSASYVDDKGLKQEYSWAEDGTVLNSIEYDESGNYLGHHEFYPSGKIKAVIMKSDNKNKRDRYKNYWDEDGNQTMKDGRGTIAYSDGKRKTIAEYENGLKHGIERTMEEDGSIASEIRFENGYWQVNRTGK